MGTLLFALTFISPPFIKKYILRWFLKAEIGHHVYIGWFSAIMAKSVEIGDYSQIKSLSIIKSDAEFRMGSYSVISNMVFIYGAGSFILGDKCYIGPQCLINIDNDVRFGNVSALGPRSMIFTHGSFLPYTEGYWVKLDRVTIGDYVWMAAGVFVHPGVTIGNNVFVNSRAVVQQNIADGEVVAGNPARSITRMNRLRRKMSPARVDKSLEQIINGFKELVLRRHLDIRVEESDSHISFAYENKRYLLKSIPSNGNAGLNSHVAPATQCIFLVNASDWRPPARLKKTLVFDFTTNYASRSGDRIHHALWDFMRMYYGTIFRFATPEE